MIQAKALKGVHSKPQLREGNRNQILQNQHMRKRKEKKKEKKKDNLRFVRLFSPITHLTCEKENPYFPNKIRKTITLNQENKSLDSRNKLNSQNKN